MQRTKISANRFDLRRIRKPVIQGGLSSTVIVEDVGYVNIGFNHALVRRAGMVLPRGLSSHDPAFMVLKFNIKEAIYKLYVQYLNDEKKNRYLLLDIAERPKWIDSPARIIAETKEETT